MTNPQGPTRGLPRLRKTLIDEIEDYLMTSFGSGKPPIVASSMLALIVQLDEDHTPWPMRAEVAQHINAGVFGVDAALAAALDRGLIEQKVEVVEGNIAKRPGVRRNRYYKPTRRFRNAIPCLSVNKA